jgi:hypothetical protein
MFKTNSYTRLTA